MLLKRGKVFLMQGLKYEDNVILSTYYNKNEDLEKKYKQTIRLNNTKLNHH